MFDKHKAPPTPLIDGGAILFCQGMRQLHHSGTVFHMEFDFRLSAVTLESEALHFGVEHLGIQIGVMLEVCANGGTNRIVGICVDGGDRQVRCGGGALLTPAKKRRDDPQTSRPNR